MADETTLIQGRYRLLDLIGRGGMGEVWQARDEALGRRVAVKSLKPLGQQPAKSFARVLRERFRREARVAAGLQHRGVTVVHDFGEHEGVLYLVMELLDGLNLGQLLEKHRRHPLPAEEILDIAGQVAAALAYTHDQEIVHRDLKPANVMRLTDGTVKICDFGIARLGHEIGFTAKLTGGTGVAMGTPHYMSPEQIAGGSVDHRSDLYSLGCVLYEIATGVPPFDLDDTWSILVGHRDTEPEPLRVHRADIPGPLERIVLDLLAKDPEERPADAAELGRRITAARRPVPHADPVSSPGPPARLPSWTQGMRVGSKAGGARSPTNGTSDHLAVLNGHWTFPADPPLVPAPKPARFASASGGAGDDARPTPSPELLALLVDRHHAGLSLGRLGRWEEAGEAHRAVAAERARALGPDHPDTLASHYEIGFALNRQGRHAEALSEYERVAVGREKSLGPGHPDTLAACQESAYVLGRLGRWEEALRTYRQVAAARTRVLGPDHPDTLAARYEIGISLGRLGRSAEALDLYRDLVGALIRAQGPGDPETLRARHGFGVSLGRLGRWEEALDEARDVCAVRERVLGQEHPDTLVSRREVAVALGWLGRWGEALDVYRMVARSRERVLGAEHPDTLISHNDEAHCLEQLGRSAEAVQLYRRVAALRQRRGAPER